MCSPCWPGAPPPHTVTSEETLGLRPHGVLPGLTRLLLWDPLDPSLWLSLQRESKTDTGPSEAAGKRHLTLRQGASPI